MGAFRIETERLVLREWDQSDQAAFDRIVGAPEVQRWIGAAEPGEQGEPFIARMRRNQLELGWALWAVELRHKAAGEDLGPIGFAGFGTESLPEPELAWTFIPGVWNKGYATEAGIAARDYGFGVLGMKRAVSVIDPSNTASVRVAQKVGLVLTGTVECHGEPHLLFEIDVSRWRAISNHDRCMANKRIEPTA